MSPNATPHALSTGQAARYCYVTSYTIVNWINAGHLKAQRTVGGQYRILVHDLRDFMLANNMRTDLLDTEMAIRPHCWEFHCRLEGSKGECGENGRTCRDCPVRRAGAQNCWELHDLISPEQRLVDDCKTCEYYRIWHTDGQHNES